MSGLLIRGKAWCQVHQRATDVILMLIVLALIAFTLLYPPDCCEPGQRSVDAWAWLLGFASTAPIAARRTKPAAALAIGTLATVIYWVVDYVPSAVGATLLILAYSAAAYVPRRDRARTVGLAFGSVIAIVTAAGVFYTGEDLSIFEAVASVIFYGTAWVVGDNVRTHRIHVEEMQKRALAAEAQRDAEAARAVEQERTAIARELHDVVAHGISVMVVQATAARRVLQNSAGATGDPTNRIPDAEGIAKAEQAIAAVEETGRTSLDEMRRLLGVLRPGMDDEASRAPLPGLADLSQLVEQVESAGLPVALVTEGEARTLPAGIELSAYRIVQESLTNAIKHAGPAVATVTLTYATDALAVEVTDDGRGNAARAPEKSSGQGLLGMRERVESIGGTFWAGPKPGGGYRVKASLPVSASLPADTASSVNTIFSVGTVSTVNTASPVRAAVAATTTPPTDKL